MTLRARCVGAGIGTDVRTAASWLPIPALYGVVRRNPTPLELIDRWLCFIFDPGLQFLHFLGMPDRPHVFEQRVLTELDRGSDVDEAADENRVHDPFDHVRNLAANRTRANASRSPAPRGRISRENGQQRPLLGSAFQDQERDPAVLGPRGFVVVAIQWLRLAVSLRGQTLRIHALGN